MTFGQKIKKLRTDANLTQKELATKLNVTFQTVSKWESDINEPDIKNIKELAKIFNCSFEYLFNDNEEVESNNNNNNNINKDDENSHSFEVESPILINNDNSDSKSITENIKDTNYETVESSNSVGIKSEVQSNSNCCHLNNEDDSKVKIYSYESHVVESKQNDAKTVIRCGHCGKEIKPNEEYFVDVVFAHNQRNRINICKDCQTNHTILVSENNSVGPLEKPLYNIQSSTYRPGNNCLPKTQVRTNCSYCGQSIYSNQAYYIDNAIIDGESKTIRLCMKCQEKHSARNIEVERKVNSLKSANNKYKPALNPKEAKHQHNEKVLLGWSIGGGVLAFIITLVTCILNRSSISIWGTIFVPILVLYAIMSDIYCIFSGSWIGEMFLSISSWSIKFPGIIFSFDLDGLMFLIGMKILFAILGALVSIAVFLLALTLSAFFAMICFPFLVIYNHNHV